MHTSPYNALIQQRKRKRTNGRLYSNSVPLDASFPAHSNQDEDGMEQPEPTRNKLASDASVDYSVPSLLTILKFAIPAIGVWLCAPLLSMMDTSAVGVLAGTAQQAALHSAVAVTDYSARCMFFLYTGATNLLARQTTTAVARQENKESSDTFLGALQLSLWTGTALGLFLLVTAPTLLKALMGQGHGLDLEVYTAALRYVRIRAWGMPAAALIGTAQAACLGLKDVQAPLKVMGTAAVLNLVLDLALVGQRPLWLGGAAGAAWATIASQYVALTLFLRALKRPSSDKNGSTTKSATTRGILAPYKLTSLSTWTSFPTHIWKKFRPFVLPVTTTQVGRCSMYVAMSHVVSSCLKSNTVLAANQVVTSLLYTLIPISDSLGLTAQAFLPSLLSQPDRPEKAKKLRQTTWNLAKAAMIFGAALSGIVASLPLFMSAFTTDVAVQNLVKNVLPILGICFALHGVFCGSEGILLAHQDLKYLGRMYGLFFAVVPAAFLRLKYLFLAGRVSMGLTTVWQGFLAYHLFRMSAWVARVLQLQRRVDRQSREPPLDAMAA